MVRARPALVHRTRRGGELNRVRLVAAEHRRVEIESDSPLPEIAEIAEKLLAGLPMVATEERPSLQAVGFAQSLERPDPAAYAARPQVDLHHPPP